MIVLLQAESFANIKHAQDHIRLEESYKQCFDQYFERLYGYSFTIVGDNAEAKDIVQSAYVKLWEKRDEVNWPAAVQAYLYTTVYRLSLNTIRNRKIREGHHKKIRPMQQAEERNIPEEKEKSTRIQKAIDELPPRCKEVFYKSRMEGKKYAAIATELNISIKTVEVQIGKALKILRERLADLIVSFLIYFLIQ